MAAIARDLPKLPCTMPIPITEPAMAEVSRRSLLKAGAAGSMMSIFGVPLEVAAQAAKGGVLVLGTTQRPRHLNPAPDPCAWHGSGRQRPCVTATGARLTLLSRCGAYNLNRRSRPVAHCSGRTT